MLFKLWVASALCAVTLASPTLISSSEAAERPADMEVIQDYFNLLGAKVGELKRAAAPPACDYNKAVMPVASPTPLPGVTSGLVLKHVALGRGTQNYTCDLSNSTAVPVATGAIATLYDATCLAATNADILAMAPNVALQFNLQDANQKILTPLNVAISGHHFFSADGTPVFNLDSAAKKLGIAPCSKNASAPAPAGASVGQGNKGYGAVPWLKLLTKNTATGGLQEVYRINTAGGKAPATCAGARPAFEIQYATEYWFFGKP